MSEPQYAALHEHAAEHGIPRLGLMSGHTWDYDPKRLAFVLARYKFAAQMLAGRKRVVDIGCGDAFGTRLLRQAVASVTAVDFDEKLIEDAQARQTPGWPLDLVVHNLLHGPLQPGAFDGGVALDVLEHIRPEFEDRFMRNFAESLLVSSVSVIGMPSIESQHLASRQSRLGHVNCKSGPTLAGFLERYFRYVLLFSMNDEVVHTGHHAMAHYLLCICCEVLR